MKSNINEAKKDIKTCRYESVRCDVFDIDVTAVMKTVVISYPIVYIFNHKHQYDQNLLNKTLFLKTPSISLFFISNLKTKGCFVL